MTSRRLHDTGYSFAWGIAPVIASVPLMVIGSALPAALKEHPSAIFLVLAPLALEILVLILCARRGNAGPNR